MLNDLYCTLSTIREKELEETRDQITQDRDSCSKDKNKFEQEKNRLRTEISNGISIAENSKGQIAGLTNEIVSTTRKVEFFFFCIIH